MHSIQTREYTKKKEDIRFRKYEFKQERVRDSLEKAMAPHSSTLAWKIPWTEEPGRLQSMGSPRVGHDWVTHFHFSLSCIGEGNGNPLQCSCLENLRDRGTRWAAVYGVAQSRTQLKRLSSSSKGLLKEMVHEDPRIIAVYRRATRQEWNRSVFAKKFL